MSHTPSPIGEEIQRDPVAVLRAHGLQVTAQRLAVLRSVSTLSHATADEVLAHVRSELGAISKQSVYDSLGTLADRGIVRRIEPAGSAARYEGRVGDNHHHLVCRMCGSIVDIDCAVGDVPCLTADDDHGFLIDEAEVVYWGYCPTCQTDTSDQTDTSGSRHETR